MSKVKGSKRFGAVRTWQLWKASGAGPSWSLRWGTARMSEWSSSFSLLCVTPLKVQISEQGPHRLSLDCGLPLTVPDCGKKDVSEGSQGPFQVPYLEGRMPVLSSLRLRIVQERFFPKRKFRGIRKGDRMTGDQKMTNFFCRWKLLTPNLKTKPPSNPGSW